MPSTSYISLSLSTGDYYTAPANGYLAINIYSAANVANQGQVSLDGFIMNSFWTYENYQTLYGFIFPVKRGNTIYINQLAGTDIKYRFYYTDGEV